MRGLAVAIFVNLLMVASSRPAGSEFPGPPTLAEFAAMAEAGRALAERPFLCDRGPGILRYYGRAEDPSDQEWLVSVLSWRTERPHAVVHYAPGASGHAETIWVDQDGDGRYETVLTANSADEWSNKVAGVGSPCDAQSSP